MRPGDDASIVRPSFTLRLLVRRPVPAVSEPRPLLQHLQTLLPADAWPAGAKELAAAARPRLLATGQALLEAGQPWQHLHWIERGVLRLCLIDAQGRASNKNFHLDGTLLWPITPRLRQEPVGFWIEALRPSRVWSLPWTPWQTICADWPDWQTLERHTLAALLDDKMRREQQFLQLSAAQRYQAMLQEHPDWPQRIALRHLASWLGVTDVALSRIRRRLA